jgi:hypothetical protein
VKELGEKRGPRGLDKIIAQITCRGGLTNFAQRALRGGSPSGYFRFGTAEAVPFLFVLMAKSAGRICNDKTP